VDSAQSTPSGYCRQCGVMLKPGQTKCCLCHAEPSPGATTEAAPARKPAAGGGSAGPATGRFQYGLSSLLLFTTLLAILCSIASMSPGLGIVVAILSVPAIVRTCISASWRGARGQPMSFGKKVAVFLLTLPMIVTVIVAAGAAFFFTYLGAQSMGGGDIGRPGAISEKVTFALSGSVAVAVTILLTWLFWRISRPGACGQPISVSRAPAAFVLTLVMLVVVILAAGAAFFFTCLATSGIAERLIDSGVIARRHADEVRFGVAPALGGIAALVVAIILTWLFWKISRRKRNG